MKNETINHRNFLISKSIKQPQWLRKLIIGMSHYSSVQSSPEAYVSGLLAQRLPNLKRRFLKSSVSRARVTPLNSPTTQENEVPSLCTKSKFETLKEKFTQCYAHVFREATAILSVLKTSKGVNWRIYTGLAVMFIAAPLSYCTYFIYQGGQSEFIDGWYHSNFYHFFFLIRFQLAGIISLIGLYFYLEQDRRVKILVFHLGFLGMSLILNVLADSNDDIRGIGNFILFGSCVALAFTILKGIDYFAWRKFHKEDAFSSRLRTIYNGSEHLSDKEIADSFRTTMREKIEFESKG